MRDTPEEKPGKNGNVEVQWNSIKKCVLDTVSDLLVKSKGEHESMDYAGKD